MSFPKATLTFRGLIIFLLALLALYLGFFRNELAAQIWGAGTLFLLLYLYLASLLSVLILQKRRDKIAGLLSVRADPEVLYPGTAIRFRVSLKTYPRAGLGRRGRFGGFGGVLPGTSGVLPGMSGVLPGIVPRFQYDLAAEGGRTFSWISAFPRDESVFHTSAPLRGEYSGPPGFIRAEDCLGLVCGLVRLPGEEKLTVFPDPYAEEFDLTEEISGGRITEKADRRMRSDEMLEVRKYITGDDVRRLNWKLFAHAEELMIRIGEDAPPPEETSILILDTSTSAGAGGKTLNLMVDRMASLAARFLLGRRTCLLTPESPAPLFVEIGKHEEAFSLLARLHPGENSGEAYPLSGRAGLEELLPCGVVILALLGSRNLPRLIEELGAGAASLDIGIIGPTGYKWVRHAEDI
jgi:uncharacterized protein (DUF58 family)